MEDENLEHLKLEQVQKKLTNFPSLCQPFRRILYEGKLNLLPLEDEEEEESDPNDFYFFLFNDIVLYARESEEPPIIYEFVGQMTLRDLDVASEENSDRIFSIIVRNGESVYRLQTSTPQEREEWLTHIRAAISNALKHRVFGLTLEEHMSLESEKGREIPSIMEQSLDFIDKNAIDKEGVFRLSGSRVELQNLIENINQGNQVKFDEKTDPHLVACLVKAYLRELPEPLPTCQFAEILSETKTTDDKSRLEELKKLISEMPHYNRALFVRLMKTLWNVTQHEQSNKMSPQNLSIVLAPSLIRTTAELSISKTGYEPLTFLIKNFDQIA